MRCSAEDLAIARVAGVADDPDGRFGLLRGLYDLPPSLGRRILPYRRAALAFLRWQLRRELLNPPAALKPGSRWWRAVNSELLQDSCEAQLLALGAPGRPSSPAVQAALEFIDRPSAARWYRAHNATIVRAYLAHEELAQSEDRVERFFINLVLARVLYAHALVAAPRLALGRFAPVAGLLGDPRLGMTAMFLSLSRVLPHRYPLGCDIRPYVAAEHGFGHLLDAGVILPRVSLLYEWSATELALPALRGLVFGEVPAYAWDAVADAQVWQPRASVLARSAWRILPAQ